MKTNIKKLNLEDKEIRLQYSKLLKSFENEFDYPLGDKKFFIKHFRFGNTFHDIIAFI